MKCIFCGSELIDDALFCGECGKRNKTMCVHCNKVFINTSKFCPYCGNSNDNYEESAKEEIKVESNSQVEDNSTSSNVQPDETKNNIQSNNIQSSTNKVSAREYMDKYYYKRRFQFNIIIVSIILLGCVLSLVGFFGNVYVIKFISLSSQETIAYFFGGMFDSTNLITKGMKTEMLIFSEMIFIITFILLFISLFFVIKNVYDVFANNKKITFRPLIVIIFSLFVHMFFISFNFASVDIAKIEPGFGFIVLLCSVLVFIVAFILKDILYIVLNDQTNNITIMKLVIKNAIIVLLTVSVSLLLTGEYVVMSSNGARANVSLYFMLQEIVNTSSSNNELIYCVLGLSFLIIGFIVLMWNLVKILISTNNIFNLMGNVIGLLFVVSSFIFIIVYLSTMSNTKPSLMLSGVAICYIVFESIAIAISTFGIIANKKIARE